MSDEKERAREILAEYRNTISETPELLSLLYDADMLPEQIVTVRGAISVVAVVVAYKAGLAQRDAALKAADDLDKIAEMLLRMMDDVIAPTGLGDMAIVPDGSVSVISAWKTLAAYRKARGQDNE